MGEPDVDADADREAGHDPDFEGIDTDTTDVW